MNGGVFKIVIFVLSKSENFYRPRKHHASYPVFYSVVKYFPCLGAIQFVFVFVDLIPKNE